MADQDEWDQLDKEWLAGRAGLIYKELRGRYQDAEENRSPKVLPRVMAEMQKAASSTGLSDDEALLAIVAKATAQVSAENVLLVLAIYLAEHETPTPNE